MYLKHNQQQRVLLVEDNQTTRLLLETFLKGLQVKVWAVENAQEALDVLSEQVVNLLLVDLGLPDLPGFDLIGRALRAQPQIKVVVLTADQDSQTVVRAMRLGAVDYLVKPIHEEQLQYAVRRAIRTPVPNSLSPAGPSPLENLTVQWKAAQEDSSQAVPWKQLVDLQCLPFAVVTVDHLVRANQSFAQQFGWSDSQRAGAPLAELFSEADLAPIQQVLRQSLESNRPTSRAIPWFGRLDSMEWYKVDVAPFEGLEDHSAPVCSMVIQNQSLLVAAESNNAKLIQQMLLAREEERRFLSQELHDTVAQDLGLIRLYLSESFQQRGDPEARGEQLRTLSENALIQLRSVLGDMREALVHTTDFYEPLESHCSRYLKGVQVNIDPQIDHWVQHIEESARFDCLRVLQETIRNTAYHAQASSFNIRGRLEANWVVLEALDDGVGLQASPRPKQENRGFGLLVMRERIARWGGELHAPAVSRGTVWQLRLPSVKKN